MNFPARYTDLVHIVTVSRLLTVTGSLFANMNFSARYTDLVNIVTVTRLLTVTRS